MMALKQVAFILAMVIGFANSCANTCVWANDNACDEPTVCSPGTDCADCGADYTTNPHRRRGSGHLPAGTYIPACAWTDDNTDDFVAKIMAGSIIAAVLGVIFVVIVSLPLCCGIIKAQAKIIAGVMIGLGIFICFIPYIASLSACDPVADDICSACSWGCTDQQKTEIETRCNAIGAYAVYVYAYGWLSVILGITAAALSCCILCKCCKMGEDKNAPIGGAGGAPPVVVGAPVEGAVVDDKANA